GVSLAALLERLEERGAPLAPSLAGWLAVQAANGLHAAHELTEPGGAPLGIVHRDVSPQNILISFEGQGKIVDLGVAKARGPERSTESGVIKGKFAYMSPEQTRAEPLDRRSDIFSLGVVLHEALTGRRLFAGRSPADAIRRILEEEPPDPRSIQPDV